MKPSFLLLPNQNQGGGTGCKLPRYESVIRKGRKRIRLPRNRQENRNRIRPPRKKTDMDPDPTLTPGIATKSSQKNGIRIRDPSHQIRNSNHRIRDPNHRIRDPNHPDPRP